MGFGSQQGVQVIADERGTLSWFGIIVESLCWLFTSSAPAQGLTVPLRSRSPSMVVMQAVQDQRRNDVCACVLLRIDGWLFWHALLDSLVWLD